MNFTEKVIKSRKHLVRQLTGKFGGKPAWWVIVVDADKFGQYKNNINSPDLNLDDYGTVIAKGWGAKVPDDILEKIEEEYS